MELTRYDKPVAVLVSYADYSEQESKTPSLLDSLAALKRKYADVVDDEGLDFIQPSRECPDYTKDPWE